MDTATDTDTVMATVMEGTVMAIYRWRTNNLSENASKEKLKKYLKHNNSHL